MQINSNIEKNLAKAMNKVTVPKKITFLRIMRKS